ncbi:MAG TPA: class I SAM-dependent methyltransferase [Woeseiaceae bacterium]
MYLTEVLAVSPHVRVLHVAPERALQLYLSRLLGGSYVAADITPERYLRTNHVCCLDVTRLPFRSEAFDLILCNHVLEHVPRDLAAMGEIRRVLKKDGLSILQVPFALERERTLEAEPGDTAADCLRKFGQADHVRLYAKQDYIRRLARCGLRVEEFWAWRERPERAAYFDLDPLEPLFLCRPDA